MIHIGVSTFGIIDQVPKVMYIATRMIEVFGVPLVPLGSVIVLEPEARGQLMMFDVRFQFQSLLYLYMRMGLGLFTVVTISLTLGEPLWIVPGLFCAWAWWYSHRVTYASYERALRMAEEIWLDRSFVETSFRMRGIPIPTEQPTSPTMAPAEMSPAPAEPHVPDDVFRLE